MRHNKFRSINQKKTVGKKARRADSKSSFFRVPAILFDRSIYPPCFGLSENAFRWYIYQCSYIKKNGIHWAGHIAARRYVCLDKDAHAAAQKELVETCLVYRYTPKSKKENDKRIYWSIRIPPVLEANLDDGRFFLTKYPVEDKTGFSVAFQCENNPFGFVRVPKNFIYVVDADGRRIVREFLKVMSPDEIDCCMNLYWQNREYLFGINPNYVRVDLSLKRTCLDSISCLNDYFSPSKNFGDKLVISSALMERTAKSEAELNEIIDRLITEYQLFEWHFWIAQDVTYREERRSIEMNQIVLRWYLNCDYGQMSLQDVIARIHEVLKCSERFKLIGQLCSTFPIGDKFETIVKNNRERLSFAKFLKEQNGEDNQAAISNEIEVTADESSDKPNEEKAREYNKLIEDCYSLNDLLPGPNRNEAVSEKDTSQECYLDDSSINNLLEL
jgi:hypothetical protein